MKGALRMGLSFLAGFGLGAAVMQLRQPKMTSGVGSMTRAHGESAAPRATPVLLPAATPPSAVSRRAPPAEPTERERVQQMQIAALQTRVRELEQRAPAPATARATGERPGGKLKFHGFSSEELRAMAENCEIRYDLPRISRERFQLSPERAAQLHLSDAEAEQVAAAVDQASREVVSRLRALYLEATGDVTGADGLDPVSLMHEILEKSPPAAVLAARAEVARERAGLPASPTGSIAERYLRYLTSVGDSLQRALEPALGIQQAAALRDALTESSTAMSGCAR